MAKKMVAVKKSSQFMPYDKDKDEKKAVKVTVKGKKK